MLQFTRSICCKVSNELRALGSIGGYRTHLGHLGCYGLHETSFGKKKKRGLLPSITIFKVCY